MRLWETGRQFLLDACGATTGSVEADCREKGAWPQPAERRGDPGILSETFGRTEVSSHILRSTKACLWCFRY